MSCTYNSAGKQNEEYSIAIGPKWTSSNSPRWLVTDDSSETVSSAQIGHIFTNAVLPITSGGVLVRLFAWKLLSPSVANVVYTYNVYGQLDKGTASIKHDANLSYADTRSDANYTNTGICVAQTHLTHKGFQQASSDISLGTTAKPLFTVTLNFPAGVDFLGAVLELDITSAQGGASQFMIWSSVLGPSTSPPPYSNDTSTVAATGTRGAWPYCKAKTVCPKTQNVSVTTKHPGDPFQFAFPLGYSGLEGTLFPGGGTPGGVNQGIVKNSGCYGVDIELHVPVKNVYNTSVSVNNQVGHDPFGGGDPFAGFGIGVQPSNTIVSTQLLTMYANQGVTVNPSGFSLPYPQTQPIDSIFSYAVAGAAATPGNLHYTTVGVADTITSNN